MVWIVAVYAISGLSGSSKARASQVQGLSYVVVLHSLLFYEVALYGDLYLPVAPLVMIVVTVS